MVRKFPEFSRFSLIFSQKVPFSRFSVSCTNPVSLVSVLYYETFLRKRMGVLDAHILKSMAGEDILVTQSVQVGTKHIVQTKYSKWWSF